ncbi:hypothetical protein RA279_28180, partial [Pseudomonas syringae pv. tagetis]
GRRDGVAGWLVRLGLVIGWVGRVEAGELVSGGQELIDWRIGGGGMDGPRGFVKGGVTGKVKGFKVRGWLGRRVFVGAE